MLEVRKSKERGHARHGWLESYHTFSFADYHDPDHMGFGTLRVINEDRVQPGKGFGRHAHRDMEIISYVIEGTLEHRDSMGNGSAIRPGDVQLMRAGTGVTHSEYNPSASRLVHFLQIWVLPDEQGLEPAYDQRNFPDEERRGTLRRIVSRDGTEDSIRIHQDLSLYAAMLEAGQMLRHTLPADRRAWLQIVKGNLAANGLDLAAGDGLAVSHESKIDLKATSDCEVLLFELA